MAPIQGSVRRRAGRAEAEPFFEDVKFAEDVAAGQLHGDGAEEQERGIEEEDARQQNRMPVADLLEGARVHVHGGLARVEHGDQGNEEHHVAGEGAEDDHPDAVEDIARAALRTTPVVIASAASSAGGPAGDGRFASGAGGFALDLRRDGSKDRGHGEPCEVEFTLTLVLTHRKSEEVPVEWEMKAGIEGAAAGGRLGRDGSRLSYLRVNGLTPPLRSLDGGESNTI